MKVSTAILLLSSLYIASALSNTPWTLVRKGSGGAWSEGLDNFGGQNNLGQAYDSGIFNSTSGEVSNVGDSWFQSAGDAAFNYSSDLSLLFESQNTQNSKYALSIDPETGRRSIIWWSLQHLTGDNNGPAGRNITYDKDTDTVTVTTFEGLEQWILYQQGQTGSNTDPTNDTTVVDGDDDTNVVVNPPNEDTEVIVDGPGETDVVVDPNEDTEVVVDGNDDTEVIVDNNEDNTDNQGLNVETYSFRDYLHNFIGYEEGNTETFMNDEGLNNAVNNAVFAVGDRAALENIILDELHTLDTYVDDAEDLFVRINADVTSDTDSGDITAVYWCRGGSNCDGDDGELRYWWWNSRLYA